MAVQAEVTIGGITITNAYIKIRSVFGGKVDGQWGAVVNVFASKTEADTNQSPFPATNVYAEYADGNPYELLYAEVMENYEGSVRVD